MNNVFKKIILTSTSIVLVSIMVKAAPFEYEVCNLGWKHVYHKQVVNVKRWIMEIVFYVLKEKNSVLVLLIQRKMDMVVVHQVVVEDIYQQIQRKYVFIVQKLIHIVMN